MIKVVVGLFLLVMFGLFLKSLWNDRKTNGNLEDANRELRQIENENKVLDVKKKVNEAKSKLQARKDAEG